jgi:hypothetical protein
MAMSAHGHEKTESKLAESERSKSTSWLQTAHHDYILRGLTVDQIAHLSKPSSYSSRSPNSLTTGKLLAASDAIDISEQCIDFALVSSNTSVARAASWMVLVEKSDVIDAKFGCEE